MPSASKRSDNSHSQHEFEEMENSIAYASDVIQVHLLCVIFCLFFVISSVEMCPKKMICL